MAVAQVLAHAPIIVEAVLEFITDGLLLLDGAVEGGIAEQDTGRDERHDRAAAGILHEIADCRDAADAAADLPGKPQKGERPGFRI